jgi:hypothetical protein
MGNGKAILIWGLLGLGLLFLLTRKSSGYAREYDDGIETIPFHPLPSAGAHQYKNEETWNIEWNEDGLPSKVTIHRNALST